jgi:hypothetical protein
MEMGGMRLREWNFRLRFGYENIRGWRIHWDTGPLYFAPLLIVVAMVAYSFW